MTATTWITPTLVLGDLPDGIQDAYRATTTGEAIQLIQAAVVAVLPEEAWDVAEDVLRVLVTDHAQVLQILHQARTGVAALIQCDCPSCLAGLTRRQRRPDGSLIWYGEATIS